MHQPMSRILVYLTCAALLTVAAKPVNAIENGQPDAAYHNVGMLGFDFDGPTGETPPFGLCSGFVISDYAFVTAAHCITQAESIAQSWVVSLEPGTPENHVLQSGTLDLATFNVHEFPILVETVSTTIVHKHPRYDPQTLENDMAVLEFPAGTFDVAPARLARSGLITWLRQLRILKRMPVGVVGYGADRSLGGFKFSIPGYRKRGFSAVGTLSGSRLTLEPTSMLDAMVLPGDSGSPQFMFGRVVSLTSFSDLQRLDIPTARWFLGQFTR